MKSITIPKSVTEIESTTFESCSSLEEINVDEENNSYVSVDGILYDKDKTTLILCPTGKVGSVSIYDSTMIIGKSAFSGCSGLTDLTIPNSVTEIQSSAFKDCSGLTDMILPDGITLISSNMLSGCSGLINLTIPDNVTSISSYAFSGCSSLTSITIPENMTSISSYVFSYCSSLTYITIPNNITNIGSYAFSDCSNLIDLILPDKLSEIKAGVFSGCSSLTRVTIPDSITHINNAAFDYCNKLENVVIGSGVISMESGSFGNCYQIKEIIVSEENPAYSSDNGVLYNKDKTRLILYPADRPGSCTIPDSVTTIGDSAFLNCVNLTSIIIPKGVTDIGAAAFGCCADLTNVIILSEITKLNDLLFINCINLNSLIIPNSVTNIGESVFEGCESLTNIYYNGTRSEWNKVDMDVRNEPLLNAKIHCLLNDTINIIGEYINKVTIEKNVTDDKIAFTLTPLNNQDLPGIKLFAAEYSEDGMLTNIQVCEGVISDGKVTYTADLPKSDTYKFMLWDEHQVPLIEAITQY